MTKPLTSCHKVEAKIYSGGEGTSHYYCPVCNQSVNADGSNQMTKPDIMDNKIDEILDTVWDEACDMMEDGDTADISRPAAKAALKQLFKEEWLRMIGEDEPEIWGEDSIGVKQIEAGILFRNQLRAELRKLVEEE